MTPRPPDEMPGELRDALARLDAPRAPRELIGRVVAERSRGLREVIPGGEAAVVGPAIRPRFVAAAAVVLAAAVGALERWPVTIDAGEDRATPTPGVCEVSADVRWVLTGGALLVATACAQEPTDELLAPAPPAAAVNAHARRAGTWVYGDVTKDGQVRRREVYRLTGPVDDDGEWIAVSTWQDSRRTVVDTLHLAADGVHPTLRVLRRTVDGRAIRHLTMTYAGPRIDVVSDYPGYPSYRSQWSASLPADLGPIVSVAHGPGFGFAHVVQILPLEAGWAGSVYVAPMSAAGYRAESLRVTGDGTIRVPAGTFDCWRVAVGSPGREWLTLWVAKEAHHLVKVVRLVEGSEGAYHTETVLLSFSPA